MKCDDLISVRRRARSGGPSSPPQLESRSSQMWAAAAHEGDASKRPASGPEWASNFIATPRGAPNWLASGRPLGQTPARSAKSRREMPPVEPRPARVAAAAAQAAVETSCQRGGRARGAPPAGPHRGAQSA
jgi:hypothetical protein